jgi:hypothetical protein
MLLAPVMGKESTCDETGLCVAAIVAFVRIPCPLSSTNRNVGALKTSPGWPSRTELLLHTDFSVQEWLPSLPDFRTHTQGSRMGLQENLSLQHQSSVAIGQHAEGQVEHWDWSSGARSALRASRLQRDFSPVIIAAASPPFATIAAPIRLSILPAQMTREGELQAIRAVVMPGAQYIC